MSGRCQRCDHKQRRHNHTDGSCDGDYVGIVNPSGVTLRMEKSICDCPLFVARKRWWQR